MTEKRGRSHLAPENALRPAEFCKRLGISRTKFHQMQKAGIVKTIKLGARTTIIPMHEVLRLEGAQ